MMKTDRQTRLVSYFIIIIIIIISPNMLFGLGSRMTELLATLQNRRGKSRETYKARAGWGKGDIIA